MDYHRNVPSPRKQTTRKPCVLVPPSGARGTIGEIGLPRAARLQGGSYITKAIWLHSMFKTGNVFEMVTWICKKKGTFQYQSRRCLWPWRKPTHLLQSKNVPRSKDEYIFNKFKLGLNRLCTQNLVKSIFKECHIFNTLINCACVEF